MFRDTDPKLITERLLSAQEVMLADGPVAAYASMLPGEPNRIKHLGAAFFTKFLYAVDQGAEGRPPALILDRFVVLALNDLLHWNLPVRTACSADQYGRWLEAAACEAREAQNALGEPVRADAVELAAFCHGKGSARMQ